MITDIIGITRYRYVHQYMRRNYTLKGLKKNVCEHCGKVGTYWSNISGEYHLDRDDWQELCGKCHHAFDTKYQKKTERRLEKQNKKRNKNS